MRKHIPNIITVGRIIILPFFLRSLRNALQAPSINSMNEPAALFFIMLFSDWLDGWLARRYAWTTDTGKWLDPLADKYVDFFSWAALLTFLFSHNNVEAMTAPAMVAFWMLYVTLLGLVALRLGQDLYSQHWYKRHGGQSNIFGKIKFNWDMLGIFMGMIGLRVSVVRNDSFHAPMILMICNLVLGALFAHASLMVKQGKRPLPGSASQEALLPSFIEGLARNPQSFD